MGGRGRSGASWRTDQLIAVLPAYLDLLLALGPLSPVPETLLPLLTKPSSEQSSAGKRFSEYVRPMVDYSTWEEKPVPVASLQLDAENPRIPPTPIRNFYQWSIEPSA